MMEKEVFDRLEALEKRVEELENRVKEIEICINNTADEDDIRNMFQ